VPAAGQRLIVVAPTPPPVFGHSVLTLSVLASLRRLGLLAAHVDTRDDRSLDNLNRLDFENVRLGLLAAWRLLGQIRRHPDAGVYVQISQARLGFLRDGLWIWIAAAARRPVYVHLLGGRFHEFHDESGPLMRRFIRATVRRARSCWVLTPSLRSCFDGIADPERVDVFGGTAEDPFAGRPANVRPAGDGLRLLFLSNLREGKGHDVLLAALSRLGADAAGWQVRLVGEADSAVARRIDSWVRSRPESSLGIELVGPRTGSAKADELAWADVFVFPTSYRNEGQPIVVLEAMAAGLAIVSTRHRGIPDMVRDGEEAMLAEPGDVKGFADALATLAADPDLRERLGRAARRRYEERFVPERMDDQLAPLLGG
jgi:glycosyltransferase involved in cell wall biosynthesis